MDKKRYFQILALPTLIYAVLFPILLYDNYSSFTMILFVIVTVIYTNHIMKMMDISCKKETRGYIIFMLLLAVSDMLTGNEVIIMFNNLGILILLLRMLIHNYQEDTQWTFEQHIVSIPAAVVGTIAGIGSPFGDFLESKSKGNIEEEREHASSKAAQVFMGFIIAIPLLIIVTALLSSADSVFAEMLSHMIDVDWNIGMIFQIVVMFAFAFLAAYCGMRYLKQNQMGQKTMTRPQWEPTIGITILALVSVIYLLFCGIQLVYLFWGKTQLPQGYTYAEYAREGFFQLLVVCVLNLLMVLLMGQYFKKSKVLNIFMTLISVCTYIMLASSGFRMVLYIRNYHLTFLRVLVLWALCMMAMLLAGIIYQIYKKEFHLFQFALLVVCVGYLVLSFSHVDYFIARYNLEQMDEQKVQSSTESQSIAAPQDAEDSRGTMDYSYLTQLSADAAPAMVGYEGEWMQEYVNHLAHDTQDGWRQFNVSRFYARLLYKDDIQESTDQIQISVTNQCQLEVSDIALHYEVYEGQSGSQGSVNADGSTVVLQPWKDDAEESDASQTFELTNEDLGIEFNSSNNPGTLTISLSLTDANGVQQNTDTYQLYPYFGEHYNIVLFQDEIGAYHIYAE